MRIASGEETFDCITHTDLLTREAFLRGFISQLEKFLEKESPFILL